MTTQFAFPSATNALTQALINGLNGTLVDYSAYGSIALQLVIDGFRADGYELHRIEDYGVSYPSSVSTHTMLRRSLSEEEPTATGPDLILNVILVFVCVLCAGFASGLTQGLLSLDYLEMKIKAHSGTPQEKTYAERVLPIISNHHLLLVTLMLWNASATEALPIFLNKLVPEYVAIIISVTLVLIVGEIIPASILTGPHQLRIAANLVPLVYAVLVIFFPIAFPISKALDCIIGHEEGFTVYNRKELAAMMKFQHEEGLRISSAGDHSYYHSLHDGMRPEEVSIIHGALKYRDIKVSDVMTHKKNVFNISINETLCYQTIYKIFKSGYSRIPIYDEDVNHVVSIILTKDLVFIDPEDDIPIRNFVQLFGRKPTVIWHDQKLGETLSVFRKERTHLAIVRDVESEGESDPYYIVVGIITMEDVIEEILGAEIEDETDEYRTHHPHSPTEPHSPEGSQLITSSTASDQRHAAWNTKMLRDMDFARLKALHDKMAIMNKDNDLLLSVLRHCEVHAPQLKENLLYRARYYFSSMVEEASTSSMKRSKNRTNLIQGESNVENNQTELNEDLSLLLEFMKQQAEVISIDRKSTSPTLDGAALLTNSSGAEISDKAMLISPLISPSDVLVATDSDKPIEPTTDQGSSGKVIPAVSAAASAKYLASMSAEDILYRRGRIATSCLIITEGFVKVIPGKKGAPTVHVENGEPHHEGEEGMPYLLGPWSILGQEALLAQEGTYIPDFTAVVDSSYLKFVRITSFTVTAHSMHQSGWSNLMKKKQDDLYHNQVVK